MERYAVITGATQGIGKAIAEKLLSEGFSVAVCARGKEKLEQLQLQWRQQFPGRRVLCLAADMGVRPDVDAFGAAVLAQFPRIDVLVNNAGIFFPGNLADEPEGNLEQLMSVHVFGAYHLCRKLLPVMKAAASGHIFNICSVASLRAYPGGGAYSIVKYALLGLSDNLRLELMPDGIRVTAICPGATYTASWEGSGVPAERMMQAADVADTLWAAYALSPAANIDRIVMRPQPGDL